MRNKGSVSVNVSYNGDYLVLEFTDANVSASVQLNDVQDLIELENKLHGLVERWQRRNDGWKQLLDDPNI